MGVLGDFHAVAKDLVKAGPAMNAAARSGIRQVVGALGDDLETALDVTIIYLRAGASISDAAKLGDHLADAPAKLLGYYKEFKVCEGLYGLRDEFKQVFNAKRLALSIKDFWRVPSLVDNLASGERSVLDDLRDVVQELAQHSDKLRVSGSSRAKPKAAVAAVHDRLRTMINAVQRPQAA